MYVDDLFCFILLINQLFLDQHNWKSALLLLIPSKPALVRSPFYFIVYNRFHRMILIHDLVKFTTFRIKLNRFFFTRRNWQTFFFYYLHITFHRPVILKLFWYWSSLPTKSVIILLYHQNMYKEYQNNHWNRRSSNCSYGNGNYKAYKYEKKHFKCPYFFFLSSRFHVTPVENHCHGRTKIGSFRQPIVSSKNRKRILISMLFHDGLSKTFFF